MAKQERITNAIQRIDSRVDENRKRHAKVC
jgi:hypothetical protein